MHFLLIQCLWKPLFVYLFITRVYLSYLTLRDITILNWDELTWFKHIFENGSSSYGKSLGLKVRPVLKNSAVFPRSQSPILHSVVSGMHLVREEENNSFRMNWSEFIESEMFMGWCKSMRSFGWSKVLTLLSDKLPGYNRLGMGRWKGLGFKLNNGRGSNCSFFRGMMSWSGMSWRSAPEASERWIGTGIVTNRLLQELLSSRVRIK